MILAKIKFTVEISDHDGYCRVSLCKYKIEKKSIEVELKDEDFLENRVLRELNYYKKFINVQGILQGKVRYDDTCILSKDSIKNRLGRHEFRINIENVNLIPPN